MHKESHPLAGETVKTNSGQDFILEDWWDRVFGASWRDSGFNPAVNMYSIRVDANDLPTDNEVVYGKIGAFGALLHVSELAIQEEV